MPKSPRTEKDIQTVKEEILNQAVELMFAKGFDGLSMRKLAALLNMTAANIYNYFECKDDLYLAIQKRGFELLGDLFSRAEQQESSPEDKLRAMARVYVDFGINNPAYYEIMFNRHGPKYSDYVNTPMEPAALAEKLAALEVLSIAENAANEILQKAAPQLEEQAWGLLLQAWMTLHGYVTLYNTKTLQEVDDRPELIGDQILENIVPALDPAVLTNTDMEDRK